MTDDTFNKRDGLEARAREKAEYMFQFLKDHNRDTCISSYIEGAKWAAENKDVDINLVGKLLDKEAKKVAELQAKLAEAEKALEEFAWLNNPNELKYISHPTAEYMAKAREALKKTRGESK